MKKRFENTYGRTLKGIMFAVNPLKKKILKTYCTIHKFINIQALEILKNEGYIEEYDFYREYIKHLNNGVMWADQDFKSSNHFYHYSKGRGLYGFSDALTECSKYFARSVEFLKKGDMENSIFYLGAACHLIQDVTVPQHVNNKLLKSHRHFELWIISKFMTDYSFVVSNGIIRYSGGVEDYIKNNAQMANATYLQYEGITSREERYHKIATTILGEAQRTTAGMLADYYQFMKKESF